MNTHAKNYHVLTTADMPDKDLLGYILDILQEEDATSERDALHLHTLRERVMDAIAADLGIDQEETPVQLEDVHQWRRTLRRAPNIDRVVKRRRKHKGARPKSDIRYWIVPAAECQARREAADLLEQQEETAAELSELLEEHGVPHGPVTAGDTMIRLTEDGCATLLELLRKK